MSAARADPRYWEPFEEYERAGIMRSRPRNIAASGQRLALREFGSWYVRGLAKRLLDEGVETCQIYRGAQPKSEPGECAQHEGVIVSVEETYKGHRAGYCPQRGNAAALSTPFAPVSDHVVRRITL